MCIRSSNHITFPWHCTQLQLAQHGHQRTHFRMARQHHASPKNIYSDKNANIPSVTVDILEMDNAWQCVCAMPALLSVYLFTLYQQWASNVVTVGITQLWQYLTAFLLTDQWYVLIRSCTLLSIYLHPLYTVILPYKYETYQTNTIPI